MSRKRSGSGTPSSFGKITCVLFILLLLDDMDIEFVIIGHEVFIHKRDQERRLLIFLFIVSSTVCNTVSSLVYPLSYVASTPFASQKEQLRNLMSFPLEKSILNPSSFSSCVMNLDMRDWSKTCEVSTSNSTQSSSTSCSTTSI